MVINCLKKKCFSCHVKYVGETYCSIKERLSEHLRDIHHECNSQYAPPSVIQKGPTTVARHFGKNQHTRDDLKVEILELICLDPLGPHTDPYHETREHFWIHRLRTLQPLGLKNTNGNEEIRLPQQPRLTNPGQREVTLVSLKLLISCQ